jgi:AmmeMemoRadiSam system protein A
VAVAREKRGVFVTLEAAGTLRGCIGRIRPDRPLGEVVRELAVAAAREDPRFGPVAWDELPALRIEISILTEPVVLHPISADRIVIGRDGVLVRRGGANGVLLPRVAPERRWDATALLRAACRKAGLGPDAWREPGTGVLTFQADVFAEPGDEERGMGE